MSGPYRFAGFQQLFVTVCYWVKASCWALQPASLWRVGSMTDMYSQFTSRHEVWYKYWSSGFKV